MPNVDIGNPMFQQPVALPAPVKAPLAQPVLQKPPTVPTASSGSGATNPALGMIANTVQQQTQPPPAVPTMPAGGGGGAGFGGGSTGVSTGYFDPVIANAYNPAVDTFGWMASAQAAALPQNQLPSYEEQMRAAGALNGFIPTVNPDGSVVVAPVQTTPTDTLMKPVQGVWGDNSISGGSAGGGGFGGSGSGNGGGGSGNGGGSAGGGTTITTPEAIMPGTADIPTMMRELVNMRQGNRMVIPNWLQSWMNRFAPGLGQRFSDILHMMGFQSTGNLGTGGFPSSFLVPTGLNLNALTEQALSEMSNLEQLAIRAILSMNLNDQYVQGLTQEEAQQLQDQTGLVAAPTVTPPELTQGVVTPEATTP